METKPEEESQVDIVAWSQAKKMLQEIGWEVDIDLKKRIGIYRKRKPEPCTFRHAT